MLKYLIVVQQNTLALSILLPLLGVAAFRCGDRAAVRRFIIGLAAGTGAAALIALLKAFTGWIVTEYWNMAFMAGILILGIVFLLGDYRRIFRKDAEKARRVHLLVITLLGAFLAVYVLRADLLFIREFIQGDETILNVNVVYRALGWLAALLVVALCAAGVTVAARGVDERFLRPLRSAVLLVYLVHGLLAIVQILYAQHMIPRLVWIRDILRVSINQGDVFLYVNMALALVLMALALITQRRLLRAAVAGAVEGAAKKEAVDEGGADAASFAAPAPAFAATNPAQRRKARAAWRTTRRWGTVVAVGFVIAVLSLTAVKAYSERGIELTPAEPMEYVGTTVRIPLEKIDDGHLHRFAHTTTQGVEVRFIVIKKNETSYGVGLDACNVCGVTGYYERDDQVVCKMCDVVMNKQTIGFPGGCNPIPLEFSIGDGALTVEVALLEQESDRFK